MKLSFVLAVILTVVLVCYAQQPMPRMSTVDPGNGKAGDVITVAGENLQKEHVAKVFLTDGKNDIPVEVMEQSATSIKFKIPAKVPAGRLALMVLTTGKDAKYMEQPVKVQIANSESLDQVSDESFQHCRSSGKGCIRASHVPPKAPAGSSSRPPRRGPRFGLIVAPWLQASALRGARERRARTPLLPLPEV